MHKLFLASQSPRRRQILEDAGFEFVLGSIEISEILKENVNLRASVEGLAQTKAQAFLEANKHLKSHKNLILSADTVVVLEGRVLGKPKSPVQAEEYLRQLSGKTHSVITGFCLIDADDGREVCGSDETSVEFRTLADDEIHDYVQTGEPMDKAGAYAIQGIGKKLVSKFTGDFQNVVGLPLHKIEAVLEQQGWHVCRK